MANVHSRYRYRNLALVYLGSNDIGKSIEIKMTSLKAEVHCNSNKKVKETRLHLTSYIKRSIMSSKGKFV